MRNAAEIEDAVAAWTADRTVADIERALEGAGIPFGPVATIEDAIRSEQLAARDMLVDVDHPTLGHLTLPGVPVKLDRTPASVRRPPPAVGADNELVFRELVGLSRPSSTSMPRIRRDLRWLSEAAGITRRWDRTAAPGTRSVARSVSPAVPDVGSGHLS